MESYDPIETELLRKLGFNEEQIDEYFKNKERVHQYVENKKHYGRTVNIGAIKNYGPPKLISVFRLYENRNRKRSR